MTAGRSTLASDRGHRRRLRGDARRSEDR